MNFYPFHIGDYISHTSHLSDLEDLAYRRMMDLYYQLEKPFHKDLDIARKIKSTQAIVDQLLPEFFEWNEDDQSWHSKRVDEEIAKYRAKSDSAKNANRVKSEKLSALKSETDQILTKNQEPITNNHIKTIAPIGVSDDLWKDFTSYRKRLKAPINDRIAKRLIAEADKAKMPISEVLELIMFKGWRSFDASWAQQAQQKAQELPLGTDAQIMFAYEHECGKDPKKARFNSYYDMKQFVIAEREKGRKNV